MAKYKSLSDIVKSDKEWNKLYSAYLRQHEKLSEQLNGNVHQVLSKVEYREQYKGLMLGGIEQNITRTIVSREAVVSTKQARYRVKVARAMLENIKESQEMGIQLTQNEIELLEKSKKYGLSVSSFRKEYDLSQSIQEIARDEEASYSEWVPGSP